MEKKQVSRPFLPILLIFIVTTIIIVAVPSLDFLWGMDKNVMLAGNLVLLAATLVSFNLYRRSLYHQQAHAFIRMIYGGMFAKLMICLVAALAYIMVAGKSVSKGAVFGLMFLYFVYTFTEISIIMKLSRKEKHAKDRSTP